MSFSKIVIMGNLTADPEQRTTPNGRELTSFTIAVNTRTGREENTAFYRCTMWGSRGEAIAKYVSKGQQLLVSGTLSVRGYQAKDGTERQSLEINVDDFSFVGSRRSQEDDAQSKATNTNEAVDAEPVEDIDEPIDLSDIPF